MIQKLHASTIACFFLLMAIASADEWEVHSRYENADSFKHIGEYFGGGEHYDKRIVMRTQKESRNGYYWIIYRSRERADLPAGGKFVLEYFPEKSGTSIKREYPIAAKSKMRTIYLGVTGNDWERNARPVAWRIQLLDAEGKVQTSKQSFLWSYPSD